MPLGQNSCCLIRITNQGATTKERSGEIRTRTQGQSGGATVAAGTQDRWPMFEAVIDGTASPVSSAATLYLAHNHPCKQARRSKASYWRSARRTPASASRACASIPYSSAIRRKISSRQDAGVLHVDEITCIDNGQGTAIPWLPAGRAPCS